MNPSTQSSGSAAYTKKHETVLVLQGGGSLGAYECGVYKSLVKHGIAFDIVAGTSIGAVNAAIIASNDYDDSVHVLEDFWLDIAETLTPSFLPDYVRSVLSVTYAAMYGNPKIFLPIWWSIPNPIILYNLPYLYDIEPLKKTIKKYVNFARLTPRSSSGIRLILTCTDIQKGERVIYDSKHVQIDVEHLAASVGFPFYGLEWTYKDGRYLWDGSLLSNTPLREVIDASPILDKIVYIVNLFPHVQKELPRNIFETWHRARDILYIDKTDHNVRMSKVITRYLNLLRTMHDILSRCQLDDEMRERLQKIESEYYKLCHKRGTMIKEIIRIERKEKLHFLFEDADFSLATIKKLIKQGEEEADAILTKIDS